MTPIDYLAVAALFCAAGLAVALCRRSRQQYEAEREARWREPMQTLPQVVTVPDATEDDDTLPPVFTRKMVKHRIIGSTVYWQDPKAGMYTLRDRRN